MGSVRVSSSFQHGNGAPRWWSQCRQCSQWRPPSSIAAVIRKPPPDWKQPSGRPNHTRLRAIEPDLSETTEHPLENTGVQLSTWLRSRRVCREDREDVPCNMRRQISWWCRDTSTDHTCNEVCCAFAWLSWLWTDSSSALSESTTCFRLRAWLVAESTPCWLSCTSRSRCSIWQHRYQTDWLRFYIPLDTKQVSSEMLFIVIFRRCSS